MHVIPCDLVRGGGTGFRSAWVLMDLKVGKIVGSKTLAEPGEKIVVKDGSCFTLQVSFVLLSLRRKVCCLLGSLRLAFYFCFLLGL